eukprot:5368109-Prymnesium_polylepis.1
MRKQRTTTWEGERQATEGRAGGVGGAAALEEVEGRVADGLAERIERREVAGLAALRVVRRLALGRTLTPELEPVRRGAKPKHGAYTLWASDG